MAKDEPPKDASPKVDTLRLVVRNDSGPIIEQRRRSAANDAHNKASESLTRLVANLLRVIAGAGEAHNITNQLLETSEFVRLSYEAGNRDPAPGLNNLLLDEIFRNKKEHEKPDTEEGWNLWAEDNPYRDYEFERHAHLNELRRHILREIASTITQSDLQIRREEGEIGRAIRRLNDAEERYRSGTRKASSPYRRSVASQEIEKIRINKRDDMIANLKPHQRLALRAVHTGDDADYDASDSFVFDVLARMKLLERKPGRGRSKRDWKLTELGTIAISTSPVSKTQI